MSDGVVLDEATIDGVTKQVLVVVLLVLVGVTSDFLVLADAALVDSGGISVEVASGTGLRQNLVGEEILVQLHLLVVAEVGKFDLHSLGVLFPVLDAELSLIHI